MIRKITPNQIILIVISIVLLLLTTFSFYLLQDPTAPLPFSAPPPINTILPIPASPTNTPTPTFTNVPTRQTSYTPFAATLMQGSGTPPEWTGTPSPTGTPPTTQPTSTFTLQPGTTLTITPTRPASTGSPTTTQTLMAGEYAVTGRILQNGTPVPYVAVKFTDDDPPRQSVTITGGHYSFITLAPGTSFILSFAQSNNIQLTPVAQIASLAWIEGTLPTNLEIITLPDLDVSLLIDGMIFELQSPNDGATYSAAAISASNPLQFIWSLHSEGESYHVELGLAGNETPLWKSVVTTSTNLMWNGTLDDGSHISAGTYWWRVAAKKTAGGYSTFILTQERDILFNP